MTAALIEQEVRPGPAPGAGRKRRWRWVLVAAAVLVVAAAVVIRAPAAAPSPLDPASTAPDGTRALVLLLGSLGVDVRVGPVVPSRPHGVALLLQDRLNGHDRAALQRWVASGGHLVVTDPLSPLAGVSLDESTGDAVVAPAGRASAGCRLPGAQAVDALDTGGGTLLRAGPGQVGCFPAGQGAFLVARTEARGTVVVLASPVPWTNAGLAVADDSVLAAGLLAPATTSSVTDGGVTDGSVTDSSVTVIGASAVGGGRQGLLGLIPGRVTEALWGLVAAFVVVVAWRARRLGRPVPDPVPVELPGSALVVATGHLLQEGGHRAAAATVLRDDLRRLLADRLGSVPDLPAETVAALASARTGIPTERLRAALDGSEPTDDRALVALARTVDEIRQEVTHAR